MTPHWRREAGYAVALLAPLGACAAHEAPSPPERVASAAISGTTWTLRELDGQLAPDGQFPAATLTFAEDGILGGTSACNRIGGGLRWGPGRIERIENAPTVMTAAGCPDEQSMEVGGRFWGRMEQARTWTRDGATLWIAFADGSRARLALIR